MEERNPKQKKNVWMHKNLVNHGDKLPMNWWSISSINIMIEKCDLCFLFTLKRYFATDWIYYWNSGNFHQNAQNAHLNVFKLTSFQQAANQATTSQQEHLKQMISDLRFGLFFWWPGWVASKVLGFLLQAKKGNPSIHRKGWAWPSGSHSSTTRLGIQACCRCRSGRSFLAQNVGGWQSQPAPGWWKRATPGFIFQIEIRHNYQDLARLPIRYSAGDLGNLLPHSNQ